MAKQTSLFLHTGHNMSGVTFVNADGTTAKTVFTAGSNDSDVKGIWATTDDTSAVNLKLFLYNGVTSYLLGCVNIPTLSGTNGTAATVNLLNSAYLPGLLLDASGKNYIPLKTGWSITVAPLVSITSTKTCWISAAGHDY